MIEFPPVLLTSLRKGFPHYGRGDAASSMEALRKALVRLTEGERDGSPLSAEAAVAFLRGKIEEAKREYAFVPWLEVWDGKDLIARFSQHKVEHIFYRRSA